MTQTPVQTPKHDETRDPSSMDKLWAGTVAATVVSCSFQLLWFARTCFPEIDYDGVGYIGIARHIRQGQFHAALNSIRSPLISWLIAALSLGGGNYLYIGKLVNIGSFLLCVVLLYALAKSLWRSRLAGALAALLFVLGRSLAASAVESITPDFLFAAIALVYFLLLLRALRKDRLADWFCLGAIHGLAFFAKAFALPWLAVCTVTALAVSGWPPFKAWQTKIPRLAAAALIPALIAGGWAAVLHSKYRVYTVGSQFRLNILQWTLGAAREHQDPTYSVLTDTSRDYDEYAVLDMPPDSWMWTYPIDMRQALPKIIRAEIRNVPHVAKELTIVETPGGMLAFVFALFALARRRRQNPDQALDRTIQWRFAVVIAVAAVILVGAYSMLVVDARYLYPLMPLILAVAAGFLTGAAELDFRLWRRACLALVAVGVVFSLTYRSSPFRTLTHDFQLSCYQAGNLLQAHSGSTIVSLGAGPFPEHGVGWEAGFKSAYFGGRSRIAGIRIIGSMDSLPDSTQLNKLMIDIGKAHPDAILVWGRSNDPRRAPVLQDLALLYPHNSAEKILDPALGEVGIVIFPLERAPGEPSCYR